ncbi:hypothetical protein CEP53_002805 [Fusarium sp. AF-6]|nr:hypothetical protein CEP53_002805 [Fusarium sp. AF-6]
MTSHTAQDLILEHPTNPIHNTLYMTDSDKRWARNYKPIVNATCRTMVASDGITYTNFDEAFFPLYEDDNLRLSQPAEPPNSRKWRFETEADCENWFNTEIVNVVLSAWNRYPSILQSSHNKPPSEENIPENIDSIFTFKSQGAKRVLAIGEIKRNLIKHTIWQRGNPSSSASQKKLSQELRGYVHKYQCPQVFCFDGAVLLLLQFRAEKAEDIDKESCPVDCWVLPMEQTACPLRLAFYRLLSQGWRRCQAELTAPFTVGGLAPHSREFFNGLPVRKHEGKKTRTHPLGYQRSVHATTGALIWIRDENEGEVEWETAAFWEQIEA